MKRIKPRALPILSNDPSIFVIKQEIMDKLNFKKEFVLAALKGNRDKHASEYNETMRQWGKMVALFAKQVEDAITKGETPPNPSHFAMKYAKPDDTLKTYDTVISMLEACTDDEILLTPQQFQQYIHDDWHWKSEWRHTSAKFRAAYDLDD